MLLISLLMYLAVLEVRYQSEALLQFYQLREELNKWAKNAVSSRKKWWDGIF